MSKNRKRNLFPGEGVSVQVVPCEDGLGLYVGDELSGVFPVDGDLDDAMQAAMETLGILGFDVNETGWFSFPDDIAELPESLEEAYEIAESMDELEDPDDDDMEDPYEDDDEDDDIVDEGEDPF